MNTQQKIDNYYTLYKLCGLRQEYEQKLLELDTELQSIGFCHQLRRKSEIRLQIQQIGERIRSLDQHIHFVEEATRQL